MQSPKIELAIKNKIKAFQRNALTNQLLITLPWCWLLIAGFYWICHELSIGLLAAVTLLIMSGWRLLQSARYKTINSSNVLLHLNRQYPELEESAQLVLQDEDRLPLLQKLQRQKISQMLAVLLSQQQTRDDDKLKPNKAIGLNIVSLLIIFLLWFLSSTTLSVKSLQQGSNDPLNAIELELPIVYQFNPIVVEVFPPDYTEQPMSTGSSMDVAVLEGSKIKWQLELSNSSNQKITSAEKFYLQLADESPIELHFDGQFYSATAQITQSQVYYLASEQGRLEGIYALTVTLDKAPQIRFVSPINTTTEIPKDALPELLSEVIISDDFALSKIDILASIAKGSGEGVKFRDQRFTFDKQTIVDGKTHYYKRWQLKDLGMEPGDEFYFSVWATDNRQPQGQMTRSPSKIVRWLEEEQNELASEGMLLNINPTYFKSQRQIIIETEQLITDKEQISDEEFKSRSQDLGFAQSDLKQKYGQFLGDEIEGAAMHSMESAPEIHGSDNHDTEAEQVEEHQDDHHAGHEEETGLDDKSGASQLIAQYGHNHGEAELGFTGMKDVPNPTALMKRAITNMWNAESHLMMAEPGQALPFEQEALKYLNQAKKADRIYVKRLGFEPPPVSESRRYQGSLTDISNKLLVQNPVVENNFQQLLSISLEQLTYWLKSDHTNAQLNLSPAQLKQLKTHIKNKEGNSSEVITHIATIEKLSVNTQKLKHECLSCIEALAQYLWLQLPTTMAEPTPKQSGYLFSNPTITDYQKFLDRKTKP